VLEIDADAWLPTDRFSELGVDSVLLTRISNQIETEFEITLAADVLIDNDTLEKLSRYLIEFHAEIFSVESEENKMPLNVLENANITITAGSEPTSNTNNDVIRLNGSHKNENRSNAQEAKDVHLNLPTDHSVNTPLERGVAIVGVSTLVPGAENATEFWNNLKNGVDSIGAVPEGRWLHDHIIVPEGLRSITQCAGGFIDRLEYFDAAMFDLPSELSAHTDPLVRVALWSAQAALADAGLQAKEMSGVDAGVFMGSRTANWNDRISTIEKYSVLGTAQNFTAAHISHWLNLSGPSMVVDTACSSSLYAIHLACQSLLNGECRIALAGGSEILLDEKPYQFLGRTGALSPTGRCKTFDASADGFVPGEGGAMLVLKQLSQALLDGDRIYAVIESSAVNNDGKTMGVTTPNPDAQKAVVRDALQIAGIDAAEIGYMEAHGTGTELGDPLELKSLSSVFSEASSAPQYCGVGSVKSAIGHLLSSAGAAAAIKVALSIHHGSLVPTLHCNTPNPRFKFSDSPFFPVSECQLFEPKNGLRRAGINAFGFGGTNVHVQLSDRHLKLNYKPVQKALDIPIRSGPYAWLSGGASKTAQGAVEAVSEDCGFQLVSNN